MEAFHSWDVVMNVWINVDCGTGLNGDGISCVVEEFHAWDMVILFESIFWGLFEIVHASWCCLHEWAP